MNLLRNGFNSIFRNITYQFNFLKDGVKFIESEYENCIGVPFLILEYILFKFPFPFVYVLIILLKIVDHGCSARFISFSCSYTVERASTLNTPSGIVCIGTVHLCDIRECQNFKLHSSVRQTVIV